MFLFRQKLNNKSFTLIELLIVIAILALLMSIIIITLNPAEMLKKSRDTKRISNVKSINTALSIFQATRPTTSTGTANIVYISIPDSSSTCANLGLPSLPSGYTYQCSTSTNHRKTNGTGWIPVNFDGLDIGSPLSSLPIDPTNTTSTGLYFTYVTGGSWELTSQFESTSYSEQASTDGGIDPASFEFGTDLSLSPFTHGLVGYWKFDETGTSATDSSGFNNTGTIYSSTTPTDLHTTSCKSGGCLGLDGVDDYVEITHNAILNSQGFPMTVLVWFKRTATITQGMIYSKENIYSQMCQSGYIMYAWMPHWSWDGGYDFYINQDIWYHSAVTYDKSQQLFYKNGALLYSRSQSGEMTENTNNLRFGTRSGGVPTGEYFTGAIDSISIYHRALSAQEILNIYNSGQ
jgi:prepilin-type N-terminal cleavage/methylation domain-containing protein